VVWIGAQVKHGTGSGSQAILVSTLGLLATVLGGLVLLKRLDQFWVLVRRAAGYDQRSGMIGTVFVVATIIGVTLFALWFLLVAGPAQSSSVLRPPSNASPGSPRCCLRP
jgi:hypothetical protein